MHFKTINRILNHYSDTSANEDNSFRNHIRQPKSSLAETHIQTEKISSWNGPTVHVCCFMLARASTKTFVSRIHIRQPSPKNSEKNLRQPKNSLAGSLVSRGITVFHYTHQHMHIYVLFKKSKIYIKTFKIFLHVSITRSSSGTIYEQYMLPEDDRVIETCRSILNILM